jgi:hypothetical protein
MLSKSAGSSSVVFRKPLFHIIGDTCIQPAVAAFNYIY